MPIDPGTALFAASSAINIGRSLFGQPEFPISEDDINKEINLELNRALSSAASDTRRRLIGAGQEGSGTIDASIQTAQARIRNVFERRRAQALNLLRQSRFQADQGNFDRSTQLFGDLGSIGLSTSLLNRQGGVQLPGLGGLEDFTQNAILGSQGISPAVGQGLGFNNALSLGTPQAVQPAPLRSLTDNPPQLQFR